jgi:hypothetical protein
MPELDVRQHSCKQSVTVGSQVLTAGGHEGHYLLGYDALSPFIFNGLHCAISQIQCFSFSCCCQIVTKLQDDEFNRTY